MARGVITAAATAAALNVNGSNLHHQNHSPSPSHSHTRSHSHSQGGSGTTTPIPRQNTGSGSLTMSLQSSLNGNGDSSRRRIRRSPKPREYNNNNNNNKNKSPSGSGNGNGAVLKYKNKAQFRTKAGVGAGTGAKAKVKPKARGGLMSKYGAVDDADADEFDEYEHERGHENGYDEDDPDDGDDENDGYGYEEDDDDDDEEEEEEYTLTQSSYKRTLRLYTFVPLTATLTLLFFTLLQKYTWPTTSSPSSPSSPSSFSLSTTLSLLLLGTAFWTVSFALRIPLFLLSSHLFGTSSYPGLVPLLGCVAQVLCEEVLRFAAVALAQIQPGSGSNSRSSSSVGAGVKAGVRASARAVGVVRAAESGTGRVRVGDQAFEYVWTIALGWALAEVVVSVWQGYSQLALYRDVVVAAPSSSRSRSRSYWSPPGSPSLLNKYTSSPTTHQNDDEYEDEDEDDENNVIHFRIDNTPSQYNSREAQARAQARSELESLYGCPVPEIPVSISCLLRIDTIMLSIALFLLISFSYLHHMPYPVPTSLLPVAAAGKSTSIGASSIAKRSSSIAPTPSSLLSPPLIHPSTHTFTSTIPTFLGIVAFHIVLGLAWTPNVLPRIGLHVASYCSCIAALGALFVGLGWWDGI